MTPRALYDKIAKQNKYNAAQYCAEHGAHLPSARELAQLSMNLGAKGIVGTCVSGDQQCTKVSDIQNADGSKDEFYFNYSGYKCPADDLCNVDVWSSSLYTHKPFGTFALYLGFGGIGSLAVADSSAVICVVGR